MLKKFIERQLSLIFGHTENSLSRYFEKSLGRPVSLVLTDNSTSMLSVRVKDAVMCVRLHRMFLNADEGVIDEIVSMLKNRRGEMVLFRRFVHDNRDGLCKKPPQKVSVKTTGRYHDLRKLFDEINAEHFDAGIQAVITWGSRCSRYAVRRRTLGSYSASANIIRINPALDKKTVPRYFVAFVVYHEMLHAAIGVERQGGRRIVHSREFKKRERLFNDYERAIAWEKRSAA
ncbi:MAG: SprT-like domain-containing protein [Dissulfurispiraceae bacterium]|jgi:hypothetical protein